MYVTRRVLIIDKSIDRKKRLAAVKQRGFAVFPALNLSEARTRCRPGAYDLVIINPADEESVVTEFCEQLRGRIPAQAVLLIIPNGSHRTGFEHVAGDDPEAVADKVEAMLGSSGRLQEASRRTAA
jgi:hypothetical protein